MRIFLTILITCMVLYVIFLVWALVGKFNKTAHNPSGESFMIPVTFLLELDASTHPFKNGQRLNKTQPV